MKTLVNRATFNLKYFFFWIAYFVFARLIFLMYYFDKTQELSFLTISKTVVYGLRLDASFSAYISLLPFLLIVLSIFISNKPILKIIKVYTYFVIVCCTLLLFIDAGLYKAWGIRLDATLLDYLNTPELMVSSASTSQLVFGGIFWLITSFLFIKFYKKLHQNFLSSITIGHFSEVLISLFLVAFLILPIRGGLQTIPINQSNVYFSKNMFANHAALNYMWNFTNTISHKADFDNPYQFFEPNIANNIIQKTKNKLLNSNYDSILATKKPNVILIIWESLSAKIVGSLGGEKGVTPNLNRLSKEGVLFTNFYSNGDRTDKGIPAILSGYYPQPVRKIMKLPSKTRSLPMLPFEMNKLGYETSFYYGGDLNFGNMNTYLLNAGITNFVDGSYFDSKDWNSKWGAYDDIFMKKFADDLANQPKEPFFKIALTLSSHEPYEIKGEYKFGKKGTDNLYRSAHFYTDKVIGDFIEFAKKQDWYQNTVIVIMSDHGHSSPKHEGEFFAPIKFQIPMLWLGGAVNKNMKEVDAISSQVDFSYTLLDLLGGDNSKFVFGKNLFNTSDNQYAYYSYNKGFGVVSKKGKYLFDYIKNESISASGTYQHLDSLGKAITQNAYDDYLNRK
ncbi:LTA synthase family protein [Polaribacter sp. MED152]|uniref:LTA synthase family protein n=1 Tax=Polaribacter sp. MED152 TaxID=313598 RepID=UPI000068CB02|nr:LTA synthase family protein [Polaribacter sp. MED152]EAQ41711.1 sulfatase [Polaribacter sp. MED152]